jgi:hypothetical protein
MTIPRLSAFVAACMLSTACDISTTDSGHLGGGSAQLGGDGYGSDWTGVFVGAGSGVVGSMNVQARDVKLAIELDPDSVRVDGCRTCVTIALDTLFWLPNVSLTDPQSVIVRYTEDGVRHVLGLGLFSGAGGTANVVEAGLRLEMVDGGAAIADMSYVLER